MAQACAVRCNLRRIRGFNLQVTCMISASVQLVCTTKLSRTGMPWGHAGELPQSHGLTCKKAIMTKSLHIEITSHSRHL